jgi:N-acetyl-alpha-D-glucosaminyl L-malate synthase BshA
VKLRVGVLSHPSVGGSARVAVELAAQLAQRGHEVHLFSRSKPFGMVPSPRGAAFCALDGGTAELAPGHLDLGWSAGEIRHAAADLARSVQERSIQVLHFHYAVPFAPIAEEVRRRLGASCPAIIGTLHGTDVTARRDPADLLALRRALMKLDALTAVSASHAALAARTFRLSRVPVVIPNFVDLSKFYPLPMRTPGRPRIVHVSNFREVKDPQRMSRVFLRVRRAVDAELWLVGDGPMMPAVRAILARSYEAGDVRFLGLRREVQPILADMDLLLLTSREESFSMVTLEAAACGVPTTAPDVGGLPEVIGGGGVLYDRDDDQAAVDAVLGLLRDPARHQTLAKAALAQAERFSAGIIVPRYEALYRLVLAQQSHPLLNGPIYSDIRCAR